MTDDGAVRTISHPISIDALGERGARFIIAPNEAERAAIAARLDIPAVTELRGEFQATPIRGGVEIWLKLDAKTGRICVASLEPMTERVSESVEMQFLRDYDESDDEDSADATGVLREPLDGDEIDLGELLVQHLSLALDPYPRKDGAGSLVDRYRDATSTSPFAALKGLADGDS